MATSRKNPLILGLVLCLIGSRAENALGEPERPVVVGSVTTPRGSLSFARAGERLLATECRGGRCDFGRAELVPIPAELVPLVTNSSLTRIDLPEQRTVARIRVTREERTWEILVAAPLLPGGKPQVPFADWTGLAVDEDGERVGKWIEVYPKDDGTSDVVVGTVRDDVSLCGRTTLLDPKVLTTKDLELHRVRLHRLSSQERAAAARLEAVADAPTGGIGISRAVVASSAKGSPWALGDGRRKTAWAEDRGGDGRGEFVVFRTPTAVPVSSVHWALPDATSGLTAPQSFWVVTDRALYLVNTGPELLQPGGELRVELPTAEATSCVALVLETATPAEGDVHVGLAEFAAKAAIEPATIEGVVAQLNDPATDPAPAIALLSALGKDGVNVLRERFAGLTPAGQGRAVAVYDTLPCEESARGYAAAVSGSNSDRSLTERLVRCGAPGARAALTELKKATGERSRVLAGVVATVNPRQALRTLVPLLAAKSRTRRLGVREALAEVVQRSGQEPELEAEVHTWLNDAALPPSAAIDLLRTLGRDVTRFSQAASTRVRTLLGASPDFRTRYLLLEPASHLAPGDPVLAEFLHASVLRDSMEPVRARAARLLPASGASLPVLLQAADDAHVRVREGALLNLTERAVPQAQTVFLRRLQTDPWPFLRALAVKGLLRLGPSLTIDRALADSVVEDPSPSVRRPALLALGSRQARAHVELVRERLDDNDEDAYVRAAAAATLGTLCDREAADALTGYARKITRLSTDEDAQALGRAALMALGRLAPPDLARRLQMFEGSEVPPWAKEVAAAAAAHPEPCPARRKR